MSGVTNYPKQLSNRSFIDMFGDMAEDMRSSVEAHAMFESLIFNSSDIVDELFGLTEDLTKIESEVLESVMPSEEFGECVTLSLKKNQIQVAQIRYEISILHF